MRAHFLIEIDILSAKSQIVWANVGGNILQV